MSTPLRKMGLRSSDTRQLFFDDCRVPALNVLGGAGSGRQAIVAGGFYITRLYLASQAIGLASECLDVSSHMRGVESRSSARSRAFSTSKACLWT